MTMAQELSRKMIALERIHGDSAWSKVANLSTQQQGGYLSLQEQEVKRLFEKYGVTARTIETLANGIKVKELVCADGSHYGIIHDV